jgi:Tfp pilus assembly protein PilV
MTRSIDGWKKPTLCMIFSKSYQSSFILLEMIISIALFFVIIGGTTQLLLKVKEKNHQTRHHTLLLLKLEATKQFLANNKQIEQTIYNDKKLFYNGTLLLDTVSSFSITLDTSIATIDICLQKDTICQQWKIRN